MKLIKNEKLEESTLQIMVEMEKKEFDKYYDEIFKEKAQKIQANGLAEGKTVNQAIEEIYGSEAFSKEVMKTCYNRIIDFASNEIETPFMAHRNISNFKQIENGCVITFLAIIYPKMSLKKYKGIEIPSVTPQQVTQKAIDDEFQALIQTKTEKQAVNRSSCKGDTINFDFEGFLNGVAFGGGKADGFDLVLGSGQFIPGFEEQLIGTKAEQDIDVVVTFPQNYHVDELAGKETVFKCHINSINEEVLPEINDEFIKKISGFNNLTELKAEISIRLEEHYKMMAKNQFEELVLRELTLNLQGEIPQAMVERQVECLVYDFCNKVQSQGISIEEYLKASNITIKDVRNQNKPLAEHQIKTQLALRTIVLEENLQVTQEELEKEMQELAKDYNISIEQIKNSLPMSTFKSDKLLKKAMEILFDSVVIL